MKQRERVKINEVAPRDGLQNEAQWVETADKVRLVNALSDKGFAKIEVSSLVSPRLVPGLRDAEQLFARIDRRADVVYVALIANVRGAERAVAAKVDEINFVLSASETHNRANLNMDPERSLDAFRDAVGVLAGSGIAVNGTVATAFGCPFEGRVEAARVFELAERYRAAGASSITLADTTGMANPRQVAAMVGEFGSRFRNVPLTLHFHDTRGLGLANILAAHERGARSFDTSLGGLGGCPFAPGATGNVCTEDVVHMFEAMEIGTGVDLLGVLEVARSLPALIGHDLPGRIVKAGRIVDLHPPPC